MVINGWEQDSAVDCCDTDKARTVRLRGGTKYAGRVEICWRQHEEDQFQWLNVCSDRWQYRETIAACNQLGYNNNSNRSE